MPPALSATASCGVDGPFVERVDLAVSTAPPRPASLGHLVEGGQGAAGQEDPRALVGEGSGHGPTDRPRPLRRPRRSCSRAAPSSSLAVECPIESSIESADDRPADRDGDVPLHRHRGLDRSPPGARRPVRGGPRRARGHRAAAVADAGGVEVSTHGDAFFAVFRSPAAVRAAVAAQQGLATHDWPPGPGPGPDGRPHRRGDPGRRRLRRHRRAPDGPDRRRRPRRAGDRVRRHPGPRRARPRRGRLPPRPGGAPPAGHRRPRAPPPAGHRGPPGGLRHPGRWTPGRTTCRCSSPRSWAGRRRSPRWSGSSASPACSP